MTCSAICPQRSSRMMSFRSTVSMLLLASSLFAFGLDTGWPTRPSPPRARALEIAGWTVHVDDPSGNRPTRRSAAELCNSSRPGSPTSKLSSPRPSPSFRSEPQGGSPAVLPAEVDRIFAQWDRPVPRLRPRSHPDGQTVLPARLRQRQPRIRRPHHPQHHLPCGLRLQAVHHAGRHHARPGRQAVARR